ncbi:MAG: response regulator [Planctomycetota bacterium]|jgi:DNA-binding response OmpR family regulator
MSEKPIEILLVEEDIELAGMIEHHLIDALCAHVTHVCTAGEGLCEELTARHDLAIVSLSLSDADGLAFTRELRKSNKCPVIILADNPTVDDAIEALHLGVNEFLIKPFDLSYLSEVVSMFGEREKDRRRRRIRYRRLRKISSRIIRERRDINRRMDLICRDFVHAYRRLASKVTESGLLARESHE